MRDRISLKTISHLVFPSVDPNDIRFKKDVSVSIKKSKLVLDYLLHAELSKSKSAGRDKAILTTLIDSKETNSISSQGWQKKLSRIKKEFAVAAQFGAGLAIIVCDIQFNRFNQLLSVEGSYFPRWEVALINIETGEPQNTGSETSTAPLFLQFSAFILAAESFLLPEKMNDPFVGTFTSFDGKMFRVEDNKRVYLTPVNNS